MAGSMITSTTNVPGASEAGSIGSASLTFIPRGVALITTSHNTPEVDRSGSSCRWVEGSTAFIIEC